MNKQNKPAIELDEKIVEQTELAKFMMAHECCHHQLGHLQKHKDLTRQNAQGRVVLNATAAIELEADCCAAKLLKNKRQELAIEAAWKFMLRFGYYPTGAGYPMGFQRARTIKGCGAELQ